ncbi:hypothetical protein PACTADRAFT_1442 [Pachysolen tannophilus NRRL Y-2460]|uniref:Delta(14)-sterol reductase n=1 Tax=Pachysolen tannophilus NRRL Y-2460 TaxID=669874 RepID=A0A1E4TYP0_PACTA|nr:hypothetical protein PACTADRAFT_1442 [Pachysolen tannophilus NRRL Y-2460]
MSVRSGDKKTKILNPITIEKDFGGPIGAAFLTIFLPLTTIFLHLCCNEKYLAQGLSLEFNKVKDLFYDEVIVNFKENFFNERIWLVYCSWFFILVFLDFILPGKHLKGVELRDGTKLSYKINGLAMMGLLASTLIARFIQTNGEMPELSFIYDNILSLLCTSIFFSILLSCFVYICSYLPLMMSKNGINTNERILAAGGNSGNVIFDWFMGRELNPRILTWDIKLYCELRPGMLLWLLINISCLHKHYIETGGKLNQSLLLVNLLQGFYIVDGVLNEEGCLSMIDITTDGFGFMLAFGDLTWVPFTYSLQSRYLVLNPIQIGWLNFSLIILLNILGYYVFHSSNSQKANFRKDPASFNQMKSIKTKTGTLLLCDGWWKLSQHINYFGDWIMSWSWCLPTGFNTPLTYFYVIYFGFLLLHRQKRDEDKCRKKYGESWKEYERKVPYKIIPYIY